MCKRPHVRREFKETLELYVAQVKRAGLDTTWYRDSMLPEGQQEYPEPKAHPSKNQSAKWKAVVLAKGPVGLLIQAVMRCGAQIDSEFKLWQRKEVPIDLLNVPFQHLSHHLLQMAARARTRALKGTKSTNSTLTEIDASVTNASLKNMNDEQRALINIVKAGGGYAKAELAQLDATVDEKCEYCHHHCGDFEHILWECPFSSLSGLR